MELRYVMVAGEEVIGEEVVVASDDVTESESMQEYDVAGKSSQTELTMRVTTNSTSSIGFMMEIQPLGAIARHKVLIGSLILTTALLEIPFLANAFGFTPVGWTEYGIAIGLAFLVIPVVEAVKWIQRKCALRKNGEKPGKATE